MTEAMFSTPVSFISTNGLQVNEKTEDYGENLGRALALWDKLFNLKNSIDEWTEKILRKVESHQLTKEDRERLEVTQPG